MSSKPRSSSIRRGAYRVRPDSQDELEMAVLENRYKVVRGYVGDVSYGGVQVLFKPGQEPALEQGEAVVLAVSSERYDFDTQLHAKLVAEHDESQGRLYRFAFDNAADELAAERTEIYDLFNRRATYRPSAGLAGTPAFVSAEQIEADENKPVRVTVRDISAGGVSFSVEVGDTAWLAACEHLRLDITLPGQTHEERLDCRINRRPTNDGIVRCEFDWELTEDAKDCAARLLDYISDQLTEDERLSPDRRYPGTQSAG